MMKRIGNRSTLLSGLIAAALMAQYGFGQPTAWLASGAGMVNGAFTTLPVPLRPLASVLGDRLLRPGKERRTLAGTLTEGSQTYPCTLIQELPNKVRIDEGGSQPVSLAFDGKVAWLSNGNVTEQDRDMVESLFDDTPEMLLFSVQHGGATRLLIHDGRMDEGSSRNYSGPFVTVYQLVAPAVSRTDQRQKHFYFDSKTGLPMVVRYRIERSDGRIVFIETSFGNWTISNGQLTPGIIMRSEDGKGVFTFQASSANFGPEANDGVFTKK